jgi:hypothetical protein
MPPDARTSHSAADPPQKLRFHTPQFFDEHEWIWKEEFFTLPPLWNAYHEGCDVDWCWGTIRLPDGRTFRWEQGYSLGSRLDIDKENIVWRRAEREPELEYGLIRLAPTRFLLAVRIESINFTMEVPDDQTGEPMLAFARSLRSTPSPCQGCVRPAVKR